MYAKIFRSIFDGTLADDPETRHLFMDMLVLADPDGVLDMTPQAISRQTGVGLRRVQAAIAKLTQPDPSSRRPNEEGRRLVPLDDRGWGWLIVNARHYTELRDADRMREQARDRMRRYRERKAGDAALRPVTHRYDTQTKTHTQTQTQQQPLAEPKPKPPSPKRTALDGFAAFYESYPRKEKRPVAQRAWGKLTPMERELAMQALEKFKLHVWPGKEREFIPHPASWLNARRWEDEIVVNAPAPTGPVTREQSQAKAAAEAKALRERMEG